MTMKIKILTASVIAVLSMGSVIAKEKPADRISGGARADFKQGTLVIPCVKIANSGDENLEGRFFDVVLKQRGKSLNYEVVLGELEDEATCQPAIDAMLENDNDSEDSDGSLEDVLGAAVEAEAEAEAEAESEAESEAEVEVEASDDTDTTDSNTTTADADDATTTDSNATTADADAGNTKGKPKK